MSLNSVPAAERVHIGFFGKRNAGKSSLVNAVTGQSLSIVSDVPGTTTDPVLKTMELLPLGPVVIIDTPGIDDEGELGKLRVEKSYQALNKTDIAVIAVDPIEGIGPEETTLIEKIKEKNIPYIIVYTKLDLIDIDKFADKFTYKERAAVSDSENIDKFADKFIDKEGETGSNSENIGKFADKSIIVSSRTGENINKLKEIIGKFADKSADEKHIISDKLTPGDMIVLVVPVDKAAPKGRLILPQQQTIRDILDAHAMCVVTQDDKLKETLFMLNVKPRFVITDSQVFGKVSKDVPLDIDLTSFSILFANYKGNLRLAVESVKMIDELNDDDPVLIAEGCTHHRQCGDIGTVKLPALIKKYTGKTPDFRWMSGTEYPEDLSEYKLVIHCGGCMLNEKEMQSRIARTHKASVPITNYGTAIAYMNGILKRSLSPFPEIQEIIS